MPPTATALPTATELAGDPRLRAARPAARHGEPEAATGLVAKRCLNPHSTGEHGIAPYSYFTGDQPPLNGTAEELEGWLRQRGVLPAES